MNYAEIAQQVHSGEVSALKTFIKLKEAEAELKEAMAIVQPLAIDEASAYPEKTIQFSNAVVEKRSAPATWDYSHIPAVSRYKEKVKYIEKIAQMGGGVDPDTAEMIDRAFKIEGKATIAVSLKKSENV
jgi:hypothetical protein